MRAGGRIAAVTAGALAALAVGAASRAPWTAASANHALLRLSWRAPSEVAEQCRPLSAEEKADLPVHMQVPEVCEKRAIPYLLEVRIDGVTFAADTIHGAGARKDRPVTVFREIPVATGERAIDIAFGPLVDTEDVDRRDERAEELDEEDDDQDDEEDDGEDHLDDDDEHDDEEAVSVRYSERLALGSREVALIGFDPARRVLVRVEAP